MKKNIKTKLDKITALRRYRYPTMYDFIINECFEDNPRVDLETDESLAFWHELELETGRWSTNHFTDKQHARQVLNMFFGYAKKY